MLAEENHQLLGIALVICYNPKIKKFLAVEEVNAKWWVPGGRVDAPELFSHAAIRECKQEAGIDIRLTGILRIQQSPGKSFSRVKVVYMAEPIDCDQPPKSVADKQSLSGRYMNLEEILSLKRKWRANELYEWAKYVAEGGRIYSLDLMQQHIK